MRAVADCRRPSGSVRYVVNSAGIQTYITVLNTSTDAFERTIRVNLLGHYYTAKHVVPLMVWSGGGAVVNTTSVQAFQPSEVVRFG